MKMPFPEKTPVVVQLALRRHAFKQKFFKALAWLVAGLAGTGLIVLACLVLDRFVECSPAWRIGGGWAALTVFVASLIGAVVSMLRPTAWFALAVRLDQSLPENQDRWATALDMADRTAAGLPTGSPERLARLFAETEHLTAVEAVDRLVKRRPFWLAGGALIAVLVLFGGLLISGICDLPLLAKRFWYPHGNWPRDGFTVIRLVSVNGQVPPANGVWTAIPEESAFTLKVEINRRPPAWPLLRRPADGPAGTGIPVMAVQPRLEVRLPDGRFDSQEFVPSGRSWALAHPRLEAELVFRIRAGDGLTEVFRQPVLPRLKITEFEHAIRFPGYSKLPPVKRQPLTVERLTVLEGSSVDFFVTCNAPPSGIRAVFEVFPKKQAAPSAGIPLIGEDGESLRLRPVEQGAQAPQRRNLKIARSGENRARFNIMAEESGILRIEATGTNGLVSREKAVIVEAVADAPPRLTVSGLEPVTWIAPGELVGLDYTAEDDLGVSDLLLEWTVAGGASFEHLTGEEYIESPQLGQKHVTGNQIIQRMNYYVYAQAPFEFQVVATDSKGQESRSTKFQLQLVNDDFVSRWTAGLALLKQQADQAQSRIQYLQSIQNQLNIVTVVVKGADRWSAEQDPLLNNLLEAIKPVEPHPNALTRARLEFGDLPARLEHSLAVLFAAYTMMPPENELREMTRGLRTGPTPALVMEKLQAEIGTRRSYAELLRDAALAECERFRAEQGYQTAMKLGNRLELLNAVPGDRSVFEANLTNYATQAAALPESYAGLEIRQPTLKPIFERLRNMSPPFDAKFLHQDLRDLADTLSSLPAAPTEELAKLVKRAAGLAEVDAGARTRFRTALAGYLRVRMRSVIPTSVVNLRLGRAWLQDDLKADANWFNPPVSVADVWLAAEQLRQMEKGARMDILCDRSALDPAKRQDSEAERREYAIGVQELAAACPEVDEASRKTLATLLDPVIRAPAKQPVGVGGLTVPPLLPELPATLAVAGRAALAEAVAGVEGDFDSLAARFEKAASQYDALAANRTLLLALPLDGNPPNAEVVDRFAAGRNEAQQLLEQTEAMEGLCRIFIYSKLCGVATGQPLLPWGYWEPLHGLLLAFTTVGNNAREQVLFRLYEDKKAPRNNLALVDGARAAAAGYRTYAGQLRLAARGQKVNCDFNGIMKESRTLGYLNALQKEYEELLPALSNRAVAELESLRTHLEAARLGQIAMTERLLQTAVLAASIPDTQEAQKLHDKEIARLRAAAQLPVSRLPPRQNQRDRQMDAQGTWQIADTIQNHDRRWTARVQEAELVLTRDLISVCMPPFLQADAAPHLALDYARVVELRGRELSAERRRNQGFMLLEGDSGPRLKLPKHIANEFFRARNRKPPEQFREWSETYYTELFDAAGK